MRRFAEGTPSGVSAKYTYKPPRRFVLLIFKRYQKVSPFALREEGTNYRFSVLTRSRLSANDRYSVASLLTREHCGVVFREGKRVCPQCDALPRGPLQGFRQNIPTNRQGGLSCSSSSDTKRYRRLRCGKRGSYRRMSAALLLATLLFKSSVNSSTSPASSATPKGSRRMVVASASLPKRMGVKVMPQ